MAISCCVPGWTNKGTFHYHRKRYERAEACIDRALRLDRDNVPAWLLRARCQWKNRNLQEALKSARKADSLSPHSVNALTLQGIIEFYMGNLESSFHHFERAVKLENKSALLWYDMAIVALHMKNQPEARRSLDCALAQRGAMFEALTAAYALEKTANPALADESFLEKARAADPEKFARWRYQSKATGNLLATLELEEIEEDPFILSLKPALSPLEPVTLFHPLL